MEIQTLSFHSITILEALRCEALPGASFVYAIKDAEDWLYVGRSDNPLVRLGQHLGNINAWGAMARGSEALIELLMNRIRNSPPTASPIGQAVYTCRPDSLHWLFCYVSLVDYYQGDTALQLIGRTEQLENSLIQTHTPYFNSVYNTNPRPIPEKYIHKPDTSSGQFLKV